LGSNGIVFDRNKVGVVKECWKQGVAWDGAWRRNGGCLPAAGVERT